MLPEEKVRIGLAAAVILLIYGGALVFLAHAGLRLVRRRRGAVPPALGRRLRRVRTGLLALAALGGLCAISTRFVEPFWPEVTHVRIESAKLPHGSRPIRIVHISDVHSDAVARLEPRLPGLIEAEAPDLIVFTGDSLNAPDGVENFRTLMTRLAAIAPTYAVRGNWDVWYWNQIDLFGRTGVTELHGAVRVPLAEPAVELWIAGLPVGATGEIPAVLGGIPAGALSIFLYHYPDEIQEVARARADLYCAGHTHGGQVALPFYGALVTLSRFGKRYEAGLHREGATSLYVNRGIGMEGGRAPRVRFFARPEVTVIELHPPE